MPSPSRLALWQRLEIDRAVLFAVLLRVWQLAAGVVTIGLMTIFLSRPTQGYYYLFASLVALQTFFELGLNVVVINVCSHEWAGLRLHQGRIEGEPAALSRLISLGRLLFRWYGVAQALFVAIVGTAGALYLSWTSATKIAWEAPWAATVVLSGLLLWTLPFNAMLEGCNQVAAVNGMRLVQAIVANVAVWSVMAAGGGLWAAAASAAARLGCDLVLLLVVYRNFFTPFLRPAAENAIQWQREIWPLQWRLAVGGVFSYFGFFLFTPVMFQYHGAIVAGQMGMTWTVVTAIQAAATAWVQTRVPRFGMQIRERRFAELDRAFFRATALALAAMALAAIAFWLVLVACSAAGLSIAGRVLPPLPTAGFLLAAWLQLLANALVFYVRAHKQEPFLVISIVTNSAIGAAVWGLGSQFGPFGAAAGLLGVTALITLPAHFLIWQRCRRDWHVPV